MYAEPEQKAKKKKKLVILFAQIHLSVWRKPKREQEGASDPHDIISLIIPIAHIMNKKKGTCIAI